MTGLQTFENEAPTSPKPLRVLSVPSTGRGESLFFEGCLGYTHTILQNQTAFVHQLHVWQNSHKKEKEKKKKKFRPKKRQYEILTGYSHIKYRPFLMRNYFQTVSSKSILCAKHIPCKTPFTSKWNTFNFELWLMLKALVQQRLETSLTVVPPMIYCFQKITS